jgi:Family of unknown function (DUF5988)
MRLIGPAPDIDTLRAVLEGCPGDLAKDQKIKIVHNGGYEHFERVEQPSESAPESSATFRWIMRTEMAE